MDPALVRAAERQMRRPAPAPSPPPAKKTKTDAGAASPASDEADGDPAPTHQHWLRYAYGAASIDVLAQPNVRGWAITCRQRNERSAVRAAGGALAAAAGLAAGDLAVVKLGTKCVSLVVAGVVNDASREKAATPHPPTLPQHAASAATLAVVDGARAGTSLAPAERILPGDAVTAVDAPSLTAAADRVVRACRQPLGFNGTSYAVLYKKSAPRAALDRGAVIAAVASGAAAALGPGARVSLAQPDVIVTVTLLPVGGDTVALVGALPGRLLEGGAASARVAGVGGGGK